MFSIKTTIWTTHRCSFYTTFFWSNSTADRTTKLYPNGTTHFDAYFAHWATIWSAINDTIDATNCAAIDNPFKSTIISSMIAAIIAAIDDAISTTYF